MTPLTHRPAVERLVRGLLLIAGSILLTLTSTGCLKEMYYAITIQDDGKVRLTINVLADRQAVERYLQHMLAEEDEDMLEEPLVAPAPAAVGEPAPEEVKKDPAVQKKEDAKLAKDVEKALAEHIEQNIDEEEGPKVTVDKIEVQAHVVRIVVTLTFSDLKTFVEYYPRTYGNSLPPHMRIETDEKAKLKITLKGHENAETREMISQYLDEQAIDEGFALSWTLTGPGKILSATTGSFKDKTVSVSLEASKKETVEAYRKFLSEGTTIVMEPGKLKMEGLPLDSGELAERVEETPTGLEGIPVVDAQEGFRVQCRLANIRLTHFFEQAARFREQLAEELSMDIRGNACVLQAQVYAPRNRRILGLEESKVKRAVDDKGRIVKPFQKTDGAGDGDFEPFYGRSSYYSSSGEDDESSKPFEIRLALPEPTAEAIEELEGEIIVTTYSEWKQHLLTDPKAAATPIDLSKMHPGTTLVIKDVKTRTMGSGEDAQKIIRLTLELTGPPTIRQVTFSSVPAGPAKNDYWYDHTYVERDNVKQEKDKTVRKVVVQSTAEGDAGVWIAIRCPDQMKRERLKFKLEAIDLY